MLTKLSKFGEDTRDSKLGDETKESKLGELTNESKLGEDIKDNRLGDETKESKLGVETNPKRFCTEIKGCIEEANSRGSMKLLIYCSKPVTVETNCAEEIYPTVPNPMTVETN